jgi:hypothetical protein
MSSHSSVTKDDQLKKATDIFYEGRGPSEKRVGDRILSTKVMV